jgi:hypothetical protein
MSPVLVLYVDALSDFTSRLDATSIMQDGDLPGSVPSDSAVQPANPIPQNEASLTQAGGMQLCEMVC